MNKLDSSPNPNGRSTDSDNEPPYSRLFVVCGKGVSEEDLLPRFAPFGNVEYCRLIREKESNESKGVGYVKYDKASSAALAMESLHLTQIKPDSPPLKVLVAEAKGAPNPRAPSSADSGSAGKDAEDTPPRSRLFVVCARDTPEQELLQRFGDYVHDMEYGRIVKDKVSGESKGFAYVKFNKASTAARAMEELNARAPDFGDKFKVMIAEPKSKRVEVKIVAPFSPAASPHMTSVVSHAHVMPPAMHLAHTPPPPPHSPHPHRTHVHMSHPGSGGSGGGSGGSGRHAQVHGPYGILAAPSAYPPAPYPPPSFPAGPHVPSPPHLAAYSDLAAVSPYAYIAPPPSLTRQRLFVVVSKSITQEQLAKAFGRFPGMEYCDLKKDKATGNSKGIAYINYSTPHAAAAAKEHLHGYEFQGSGLPLKVMYAEPLGVGKAAVQVRGGVGSETTEHPSVTAIRDSFAQMMSLPSAPFHTSAPPPPGALHSDPHPHAHAHTHAGGGTDERNYPEGSRLFIVLSKSLPEYVLQDVFSRFAGLEYVRLQKDKNYGFAKYTTASGALFALQYLNGTEVNGQKLKVQIAAPPTDSRKRQRI